MRPKQFRQQLESLQATVSGRVDQLVRAPTPTTLHGLRVALRRLRALLRPLAARKAFRPVYALAGRVLEATGPLRDREALADDLATHRRGPAARLRRAHYDADLMALVASGGLHKLDIACRPRPALAPAIALPDRDALDKRCRKTLDNDRRRLLAQIAAPAHDLHRVRLSVKRLRYQLEVQDRPGMDRALKELEKAQAVLGHWHDREVWLACADEEPDLAPCRRRWRRERDAFALQVPAVLARLQRVLG